MNLRKQHLLIMLALLLLNLGCESTEFEPDTSPYLSSKIDANGSSKYTNSYFYNDDNQRIERTSQTVNYETGLTSEVAHFFYNYDDNGKIIGISYPSGDSTQYSYNNGLISKSSLLNDQGEIIDETFYTYNSEGLLITKSTPSNDKTSYEELRYVYEGSDVVEIETYVYRYSAGSYREYLFSTTYLEYDQMNNPMQNGLPDEYNKIFIGVSNYNVLNDHNVISETLEQPSGRSFIVTYSYLYNDESYPISRISSRGDSSRYTYIDL